MSSDTVPADLIDLLERPLYGALGTVGRGDTAQVSPMWFEYDGDLVRFTHTTTRTKYRNLQRNPSMSLAVFDPDTPTRYVELRGRLREAVPDPTGAFFQHLSRRYGAVDPAAPADSADRVVLVMTIERVIGQ